MHEAVAKAARRYGLDKAGFSLEAWISLIVTVNEGLILKRLSGFERGHAQLLDAIQRWLDDLESTAGKRQKGGKR